jgi:hypothetical protein
VKSGALEAEFETLRPVLGAVDETRIGALDTSRQKVLQQLESLHGQIRQWAVIPPQRN